MSWGGYMQSDFDLETDELGSKLSIALRCPVHYPAYGKNLWECKCGVIFPRYLLKSENWKLIVRKHLEEQRYAKV